MPGSMRDAAPRSVRKEEILNVIGAKGIQNIPERGCDFGYTQCDDNQPNALEKGVYIRPQIRYLNRFLVFEWNKRIV